MVVALGLREEACFGETNKILKLSLASSTALTTGFLVLFQRWKKDRTIFKALCHHG